MSQDQAIQYLQQGIAAAKNKQNEEARRLLQNAIRLDPGNETAWLWLSSVAKDNQERIFCLRELLKINPQNEMAIKGLRALGVSPEPQEAAQVKQAIPRPSPEKLAAVQDALAGIVHKVMQQEDPYADIAWTHKTRNRAGERAATLLTLTVRLVPVLLLLCLLGAGALFVSNNPNAVVFAPTWTPSHTPTTTPTPTPGFTPTPSPTPQLTYTPSPTFDPALPQGDLFSEMSPTPIYPGINSRVLQEAIVMMDQGEYADVLPTLSRERELTSTSFDANPYYYEAIALAEVGDTERAERVLEEALTRLEELRDRERSQAEPLIRAGLAYVYSVMGDYRASNQEADLALEGDPTLRLPYVVLARNAMAVRDFQTASEVLNEGLFAHPGDVSLWILRGELNLLRGQPAAAQQDAATALYIDPTAEAAYLLQARADMERGDYGLAVLHLQNYLFIYPGSIQGWTLLGDARTLEGNADLAIEAYSRAVNTEDKLPSQIPAYMARAALYSRRNQFSLAYQDYDTVLSIDRQHTPAREGRAEAAYRAARYSEAIEDVDILLEEEADRHDLRLLKARALVDGANPRDPEAYEQALDAALEILSGGFPDRLPDHLRPVAYEYRARVLFEQERYNDALRDIEQALRQEESGSRHYWRGRIKEALGEAAEARREYEWVQLWGNIYSYPFLPDALSRLRDLEASAG